MRLYERTCKAERTHPEDQDGRSALGGRSQALGAGGCQERVGEALGQREGEGFIRGQVLSAGGCPVRKPVRHVLPRRGCPSFLH